MSGSVLYLGEGSGARVLAVGASATQVGTDFQVSLTTWDIIPAGEVGDCLFRSIDVSGYADNGFHLSVTPIIDGIEQAAQTFSGAGTGEFQCQAFVAERGARIAARVETLSRSGDIALHNIGSSFVVLRSTP